MGDWLSFLWCVIVTLALSTTGCTTWRTVGSPQSVAVEDPTPGRARLMLITGGVLTLEDTRFATDSVYGRDPELRDRAVPVSQVDNVQVRSFSLLRTVGLSTLIFGAAMSVVWAGLAITTDP